MPAIKLFSDRLLWMDIEKIIAPSSCKSTNFSAVKFDILRITAITPMQPSPLQAHIIVCLLLRLNQFDTVHSEPSEKSPQYGNPMTKRIKNWKRRRNSSSALAYLGRGLLAVIQSGEEFNLLLMCSLWQLAYLLRYILIFTRKVQVTNHIG